MNEQRLLVVYHELPYPINHGGRLDVWRRLEALATEGVKIHLVAWKNEHLGEVEPERDSPFWAVINSLTLFPEKKQLAFAGKLFCLPTYARSRLLNEREWRRVCADAQAFRPRAILLEGPFGYPVAKGLSKHLGIKYMYRSHNVESRYAKLMLAKSKGLRAKTKACLNIFGIERLELNIIRGAYRYFDISLEDLGYWQKQGMKHGEWLPPVVLREWAQQVGAENTWSPSFDVGYLGNLYQPNNVHGVLWFLQEVVPVLRQKVPGIKGFIAGSRPSEAVLAAARFAEWTLISDPTDTVSVIRNARVLINPVFAGSGVNTKCIEMLFSPAGLVATPIALNGLPNEAKACFGVTDQPEEFASLICERIKGPRRDEFILSRDRARACYGVAQLESLRAVIGAMDVT